MSEQKTKGEPQQRQGQRKWREQVRKWGGPVMECGHTTVPSLLLKHQSELKLDPLAMCVVLQLAEHWWKAEKLPFPTKKTIAKRIGVDPRTVQRAVTRLVDKGVIKRIGRTDSHNGRRSNAYDLRPLADLLHPLAVKAIKKKKEKRAAETAGRDD